MELGTPQLLSNEFNNLLALLEKDRVNALITGRAGTGKSTLLQLFRNTTQRRAVVLAPTGIAALNVRGQTIHSFFGFPPKMIDRSKIQKRKNHPLYKKMDILIIDEISMVRADMIDNIDTFLRINREINEPFGGVQVLFFGDLYQLPPVVASVTEQSYFRERYESPYFFSSDVIQQGWEYEMIELQKVYRQTDRFFIRILDNIRTRHFDYDDLEALNMRVEELPEGEEEFYITLTSRNAIAHTINDQKIKSLGTESFFFNATVTGAFANKLFPTEMVLQLKLGAQVMFVKNDPSKRFVNGTIGKVIFCDNQKVIVEINDSERRKEIELEAQEWEIVKYDIQDGSIKTKVVGTFKQLPVKLAWAITIHKSQGKTFERVIIDMGRGAFDYGQTYVALSRCKTLEGIVLKRPIRPQDVMVDERISEFYEHKRYYL